jgi:MoaA/NifB/PqqE/SkfB family radical SAM enzyme
LRFKRVYIEISGFCGLECDFCPPKPRQPTKLSLESFHNISSQISTLTREVSLHVLGDPLTVSNLQEYLDILHQYKIKAHITTSGLHINKNSLLLSTHQAIKQINFSLNSYNGLKKSLKLGLYLNEIFDFCDIVSKRDDRFVNLRLWNGGGGDADSHFFVHIQKMIYDRYGVKIINQKRVRVASRLIFDFDQYFDWPSLLSPVQQNSFCHGLIDQIAILSSGRVVPCCLDCNGIIDLGNIYESDIKTILDSKLVSDMVVGFKKSVPTEELCQRCSYRLRFID